MAKITALPVADIIGGDEHLPIVQGGVTKRSTMTALVGLITPLLQSWYKGDKGDRGPQGYSAGTIEQLRAAPIADGPLNFDGAVWTFVTGDFSGAGDIDIGTVESDHVPLRQGAWRRQAADKIMLGAATIQDAIAAAPTPAALLADDRPFAPGAILRTADGFLYTVTPIEAVDHQLTTAGGVKLYVHPGPRGYDARAFGARDDWDGAAGPNNFAAFARMGQLRPLTIVMPRSPGGTGVYMMNGNTALADAAGITIDADPGVSFWIEGGIPLTFLKGIRSTADFRINFANLRYQRSLGPALRRRVTELGRPGSALSGQV